jgi:hypothetical protein
LGLFDLFTADSAKKAAEENRGNLSTLLANGTDIYGRGYTDASGALNSAVGAYAPLSSLATQQGQGTTMLLNSLGLNGAAGGQTAWDAFQSANPQTHGAIDAGLEAINRRRAAAGMLNSGNSDADALKFAQNQQNQQYGNWQSSLAGLNSNAINATNAAAAGKAGAYGSLANLAQQNAGNLVNLNTNVTNGINSQNTQEANAKTAASGNIWNFGMNLAKLGAGL